MATRVVLLMSLVCLAYLPVSRCGFIWDDDQYVTNNETLRSADGLRQIWLEPAATPQYYPLVFTTFWIEYHLWGLWPVGYHWVNVVLHAINACLLYLVLRRLEVPGAWWAAAIFGLHPVHVESVAWITERKNVLSGLFYFTSLLAFLRFSERAGTGSERLTSGWYALSLLLFTAALLSKTVTCSLPAVLLLILWWKRGKITRRDILAVAPMFVLGLLLALNTARLEKEHVGARGEDWSFTPVERCLIAGRALWFYVGKLLWPYPLIFSYHRWHIDAGAAWQYLFPVSALLVIVVLFLLSRKLGKGPLVAVLVFAGSLVPALGFFDVYPMIFSFVADHFQYLASAAFIPLVVGSLCWLGQRHAGLNESRLAGLAVLVLLGALTWRQCGVYQSLETLWNDTLAKNPEAWLAHFNLGALRIDQGLDDSALEHFLKVLELKPNNAGAYYNWGKLLAQQKKYDEAQKKFQKAIELGENTADVYFNLGLIQALQKNYETALPYYEKALELGPNRFDIHFQLGHSLLQLGQAAEAVPHLRWAAESRPDLTNVREALAEALRKADEKHH